MEFWHCGEPHRIPIFRENPWIFDFPWIFLFFSSISRIFTTVPASEIRHSTPRRQKVPGQGIQGRRRQRRQRRRQVRQVSSHPGVAQKSVIRVNPRECWCSSWWIYPWLIVVIVLYYNHIIPYLDFWVNYNDRTRQVSSHPGVAQKPWPASFGWILENVDVHPGEYIHG